MAVKQKKQVFVTSDGSEFTNEDDANRHDKLCEAKEKFESAEQHYAQLLAESETTADGFKFRFDLTWYFWYVVWFHADHPKLFKLEFIGRETVIDDGKVYLVPYMSDRLGLNRVPIKDLFVKQENAKKVYAEKLRVYMTELQIEADKIEKEIAGK